MLEDFVSKEDTVADKYNKKFLDLFGSALVKLIHYTALPSKQFNQITSKSTCQWHRDSTTVTTLKKSRTKRPPELPKYNLRRK